MSKGILSGSRTEIQGSQENKRSLQRENESADRLVDNGYNVEQNPQFGKESKIYLGRPR
jgi:hypothetical protein